jgi:hypothetical protein
MERSCFWPFQVVAYSITVLLVLSMSVILSGWFTVRMRHIINRLKIESQRTASKTKEVALERRRVDRLLNELIPSMIATQFKVFIPLTFNLSTMQHNGRGGLVVNAQDS